MKFSHVAFLAVTALAAGAFCQEKHTWEFRNGSWHAISSATEPATRAADEPELDRAERLLFKKDFRPARKILLAWEKENKHSVSRDRCIYLLAEAFYQSDDRLKAFYYLDEVMDEYPESTLFYPALEKQYLIADGFLNGYKGTFLWLPIVDNTDDGVEMMYRIQQRSPGSPLAERALLRTADFYFSDRQFDLAQDAYTAYARSYPRSSNMPHVKLRAAFSSLAQFRGVLYDPTSIIDARAQLLDIQKDYPDLAAEENVASYIERIDSAFAGKILETARHYERTNEPRGAVYEYRLLVQTYPDSDEARTARKRLQEMPASALAEEPPPPSGGFSPATMPSVNADAQP